MQPDIVYNVILSDIYRDRCGHIYRGFKHVVYLKQNDNMGTLLALGRTVYPVPNSQVQGDMYDGPTYPVLVQEFLFLSPVFPGDEAKAQALKAQAIKSTHSFDENTLLFDSHIH